MRLRPSLPRLFHIASVLALLVLIAAPLGACLIELIWSNEQQSQTAQTFLELGAWQYFWRGALAASGATLISVILATVLALTGLPARGKSIALLALIPLIIPPTVYGLAWNALWAPPVAANAWWGILRPMVCMGLAYTPLVLVLELAARWLQDPAIDETARLAGLPVSVRLLRLDFPAIRGAAAAGALAVFLLCFSSFEMSSALNYTSFPEAIYQRFQETRSLGTPAALAIAGASPALLLAWLVQRRLRQTANRTLELNPRSTRASGAFVPWILWIAFLVIAIALPVAAMMMRVGGQLSVKSMSRDLLEGAIATLPVILLALFATVALGWVLADFLLSRTRISLMVLALLFLGIGIAPAVIGIGIIRFWIHLPQGGYVYGTNLSYILALMARFIALPTLIFLASRQLLPSDFIDSARLAGISYTRQHYILLIPVLAFSWIAAATPCLALMLGELGATTLLSAPGTELLSYRLHSRIHLGPESYVASFSLLYASLVLALTCLMFLAGKWIVQGGRRQHGLS